MISIMRAVVPDHLSLTAPRTWHLTALNIFHRTLGVLFRERRDRWMNCIATFKLFCMIPGERDLNEQNIQISLAASARNLAAGSKYHFESLNYNRSVMKKPFLKHTAVLHSSPSQR